MQPATVSEFICARISEETGCCLSAEQLDAVFNRRVLDFARTNCAPVGHTASGEPQYSHVDLLRCVAASLRGSV